jgi:hypothetical protein
MTTPTAPRHWSDLDEYLKAAHLAGQTVVIDHVEFREYKLD